MKSIARLAILGATFVASAPFASSATLLYGSLNTVGSSTYNFPPSTFTVTPTGSATLDLVTPGSTIGTTTGIVTGPPAKGNLAAFYPSATVTDYSFSTATISSATPTPILSFANATDAVTFFATSTGPFTPTSIPSTQGALVLFGFLSSVGPSYTGNPSVELDIAANGIGNNFTEDLIAPAPEPNTLMLLGTGLISTAGVILRRKRTV
ncbi:MAG: hypothetical protein NVS9B15_21240 [Acidobacteriaceae bacterium]